MNVLIMPKSHIFKKRLLLLVILLLGLSFRIYNLAKESIWIDEGVSIKIATKLNPVEIVKTRTPDLPLYHFILHYWIKLFGNSEFSARFPSLIFGLLVLVMAYKMGTLIFDAETGLLGALLIGLSGFHIQYSQEARMYSMMAFFTLLSFYYFVKFIKGKGLAISLKYALSIIVLILTHFFGVVMVLSQGVYLLTLFLLFKNIPWDNVKRWLKLQAVLCILFIPLGIFLFVCFLAINSFPSWWIPRPTLGLVATSFLEYSGSLPLVLIFFILSVLAMLNFKKLNNGNQSAGFFEAIEHRRLSVGITEVKNIYLLLVWLFFPIIILYLISLFLIPVYWTRYTIGCSLAFYLLIAKGLRNINNKRVKLLVIITVIFFSLANIMVYYREVHKENWREVAEDIGKNAKPADLLIFNPGTIQVPFNYYSKGKDLIKENFLMMYETVNPENIGKVEEIIGGHKRIWVITTHNRDPNGLLKEYLNKSFILLYSKEYMRFRFVNIGLDGLINRKEASIEVFLYSRDK